MLNRLLEAWERKWGRYAVRHLMLIVLTGMVAVYIFDLLLTLKPDAGWSFTSLFCYDFARIRAGEIWRLITFIFIPPPVEPLFAVFEFYLLWLFGRGLEQRWGSFRFNAFFFIGMVLTAAAGCFIGTANNDFILISIFLAFAILYPEFEMLLFFIIPVKIKWLGWLTAAGLVFWFIIGSWTSRIQILVSLANLFLFFSGACFSRLSPHLRKQYHIFRRSRIKKSK